MSIHLYCVLPRESRSAVPEGLHGLAGHGVRALPLDAGSLVAWVSEVERSVPVSIEGVREHDAVIDAALNTGGTPVPARYGQRFASDDECRAALAQRAASVASLLETLQGMVEMTLLFAPTTRRALHDLQPESFESGMAGRGRGTGLGRNYLETLRGREQQRETIASLASELAATVSLAVGPLVKRSLEHTALAELPLLTISHLVSRGSAEEYRKRAERVPSTQDVRVLVIGPRAPYSFCTLVGGATGIHGMKLAD